MPEENEIPVTQPGVIPDNQVEVKKPALVEGKIKFGKWKGVTPTKVKNIVAAIQKTLAGLAGVVAGTTIFSGNQSKAIIFILLAGAAIAEGVGYGFGVEKTNE